MPVNIFEVRILPVIDGITGMFMIFTGTLLLKGC
jgi:hypothetical protein